MRKTLSVAALVVIALVAAYGWMVSVGNGPPELGRGSVQTAVESAPEGPELAALRVSLTGERVGIPSYDRQAFGQRWSDDVDVAGGHNGCDTRNDILRRDLSDVAVRPGTFGCLVESGRVVDPYTGEAVDFVRGSGSVVEIDHIVPLVDAWYAGAYAWTDAERRNFANDPIELAAALRSVNRAKSGDTIDKWAPNDPQRACDYARRVVLVKTTYSLSVTEGERDALAQALRGGSDD